MQATDLSARDLRDDGLSQTDVTLADLACFLRGKRNADGSIFLTRDEVARLVGLLGHPL